MASRYPVTPTELTIQYHALRCQARRIKAAREEKPAARALLKGLVLLTQRSVRRHG